jgi:DsbC/DsbD-like thiol-disulfide interchange protein
MIGMRAACLVAGCLVAGCLVAAPLAAQTVGRLESLPAAPRHLVVTTSASGATAGPGGTVELRVDVVPNPGIHVYAPGAKDYLPVALTIGMQTSVAVGRTIYPRSELLSFGDQRVPVYQKPFRLTRAITVRRSAKAGTVLIIAGTVDYQACNDTICFVPASAPVSWMVGIK